MRIKYFFSLFIFISFFIFINPPLVKAVTIEITAPPTITGDPLNWFGVDVSIEGPDPATNYLRIDLYKEGTTNYFGETFNTLGWYGGSDGLQYYPIEISPDGTASTTLQGRVGSPRQPEEYPGAGDYLLKIRRYTASGPAYGDIQTPIHVQIAVDLPTPTPTESPTPTPTQTPSPSPTSTPTSKPTATAVATKRPTSTPQQVVDGEFADEDILGLREGLKNDESEEEEKTKKKFPLVAGLFLLGGAGLIGFASYSFLKNKKKEYNKRGEKEGFKKIGFKRDNL